MSPTTPMKLGAFAAALALLFGAAALAGGAVKPLRAAKATADMGMDAMSVRGLAVSDDEFTLHLARRTAQKAKSLTFPAGGGRRRSCLAGRTRCAFGVPGIVRQRVMTILPLARPSLR